MATELPHGDVIAQIYDAALDPSRWQAVLEEIRDAMDGNIAALGAVVRSDAPDGRTRLSISRSTVCVGLDRSTFAAYGTHYGQLDPLLPHALQSPLGVVTTVDSIGQRSAIENSAFFVEWARPQGMHDNAFVPLLHEPDAIWLLSVSRSPDVPAYDADDLRQLAALSLHVQRALQIGVRLAQAQAERESALRALPYETVLVDAAGRVVHANAAAGERLATNDGLGVTGTRLTARTPAETRALHRLIASAADPWAFAQPGGCLQISRRPPRPPLVVLVAPVQRSSAWVGASGAAAMLLVSDPCSVPPSRHDLLRQLYGLTDAEARLAGLLLADLTLQQAADRLGVAVGTTRNQLKQIFAKTGTHRQSELVRLLMALPRLTGA